MNVEPRLFVRKRFRPHPLSGVRHTCILRFSPTWDDWQMARIVTEEWYQRGWCDYNERQLLLNEVNQKIDEAGTVEVRVAG